MTSDEDVSPFHDGNWHSYGNGPTNPNRVAGGAPEPTDNEHLTAGGWPYTPPVIHDGVAYFATERQAVAVTTDGEEEWSRRLGVDVSGAPALDPDRGYLYVPTRDVPTTDSPDPTRASVTTLSLSDGDVVNTVRVGGGRTYGVTVANGDVYARSATTCVRFMPDGTDRWRHSLDPLVYDEYNLGDSTATQVSPAVTEDGVYVPDRNALAKLDPETGEQRWRVTVDSPYAATTVDDGGVIQTGWQETVAVSASGEIRWRRALQSRAAAAAAGETIYVIANDLHELDAETGETNWQSHISDEGTAAPLVTDDSVVVSTGDVRALRRDTEDGIRGSDRERWQNSSVHVTAFSSPVIAEGRIFVVGPIGLQTLTPGTDD